MNGEPLIILLVEDNLDHAELIRRSLSEYRATITIRHVSDGEMALNYLFRQDNTPFANPNQSPRPHVILLDLRLPKVDGLEVLKRIKADEELRRIPVVVLTTSEADKDLARAYDNYANSYLVKPLDFHKFIQLMDTLGFYWLGWNRNPYV